MRVMYCYISQHWGSDIRVHNGVGLAGARAISRDVWRWTSKFERLSITIYFGSIRKWSIYLEQECWTRTTSTILADSLLVLKQYCPSPSFCSSSTHKINGQSFTVQSQQGNPFRTLGRPPLSRVIIRRESNINKV